MNESDFETDGRLGWLADAIVRHLSNTVASYHLKTPIGEIEHFEGMNERAAVAILAKIFEGLGFCILYEQQIFGNRKRLDLWAGEPDGQPRWYVEAKMMWDGNNSGTNDHRFNRGRFDTFLSDLERLANCSGDNLSKVAIWFAFSPSNNLQRIGEEKQIMKLGDAVDEVRKRIPEVELSHRSIDLDTFGPSIDTTRFAHIFCWRLPQV